MPTISGFASTNAVVTTGWTSPTNAYASDNVYATATIAAKNTTVSSRFGGFNVAASLPAGAVINSVTCNAEMKVSTTGSIANLGVVLQSPSGTNRGTQTLDASEPAADTIIVQTVLRATFPWTAADLADGTLFAVVSAEQGNSATSCTYSLDYVQVVVDYTVGGPGARSTVVTARPLIAAPMVGYTVFNMAEEPAADDPRAVSAAVIDGLPAPLSLPYTFFNTPHPAPPVVTADAPARPVVAPSQQLAPMQPFAFVNTPHAPIDVRQPSLVVSAQELSLPLPFALVGTPHAPFDARQPSLVVSAQELPQSLPFVSIAAAKAVSVPAPQVPIRPTVVTAEPPITAPFVGYTGFNADSGIAPARPATPRPVVVAAQAPPVAQPFVLVAATKTAPFVAPQTPIHPTVVTAEPPITAPFVGYTGFNVDAGNIVAGPTVRRASLVVGAVQPPLPLPFVAVLQPRVFAAAPTPNWPQRSVVVPTPPPPPSVDQIIVWATVSDWQPPRPTVVKATELSQQLPFILVGNLRVAPAVQPAVPIKPIVVKAEPFPLPVQSPQVVQQRVDPAAQPAVPPRPTIVNAQAAPPPVQSPQVVQQRVDSAIPIKSIVVKAESFPQPVQSPQVVQQRVDPAAEPAAPIKPTVVNAQAVPPQYGQSSVSHGFAVALAPAAPPPKPIVIGAQPYPPQVQSPLVNRTPFDEKVVGRPQVIGQQPLPPQAAFILTPAGGRWGDPPPRIIQPQVTTDMSLPFRPNGTARIAHGFAPALPSLFEGVITGGVLGGATLAGAIGGGAGMTGQVQTGYVTGGVR